MAAAYTVVTSSVSEELRGGTRLAPVRTIGFNVHATDSTGVPVDVYCEARLDLSLIDVTQIEPIIANLAQSVQIIAHRADVAGLIYLQDVNKAGQLVDLMEITVQDPTGQATDTFTWPLMQMNEFLVGPVIQRHVDELTAILGL